MKHPVFSALSPSARDYLGSTSTPPVENSEVVGGPSTEDGQGACTLDLTVHYPDLNFPVRFVGMSWAEFETLFRSVALESPLAWFEVSVMA